MTKLAVVFLAALAFQASVAVPRFYEEGSLFKYLDEIKVEVRDLTLFFEKDFPEHLLAVRTVTWECNRLIEVVENIVRKLHAETFMLHTDDKIFKDVVYVFEEVVEVLKRVTVYHDVTDVHELRKCFVLSIHTIMDRLEKLVTLTYTYYPEFRFTLKYLLVDVMTTLHGIRSHFMHVNEGFEVVHKPRYLIKEIHDYTHEFTNILKEFTHRTQVKVALRGYLMYIREIVHVLEERSVLGHKELDVVLVHLTEKLRKIVFSLMEIMNHELVDIKIIKTEIITNVLEVVHIFEQLVQLCEDKAIPDHLTMFLVKIIYHYFYAVRHVCYEIKFGYKIGFYMDKYYDTDFYNRYGFGLYEKDLFLNRRDKYMFTPYMHRTLFPVDKFDVKHFYGKTFDWDKFGLTHRDKYNVGDMSYMRDFKYDWKLHDTTFDWNKLRMNYWNTHNTRGMWDVMYNNKFDWRMNDMRFGSESHTDLIRNIDVLLKRVSNIFKYNNPVEIEKMRHTIIYGIREFIDLLDMILVKCEMRVNGMYNDRVVVECINKLKMIRMELMSIVKMGPFTNVHEIRMMWIRCIEEFHVMLMNWMEMPFVKHVFDKDICYKFITVLHRMCTPFTHDMTFKSWSMDRTMPFMYNRWMRY
ncbi:hypothetical protein RN001_000064 [Aquatica leii]|uniref:Uncharacterized protein n=1 Tax=Aquatica leii TaxID=1421715 RepID=A0AAN7PEU6_9COLE|nr:hypothetical protein RN001_000064 [Aquatica leii]